MTCAQKGAQNRQRGVIFLILDFGQTNEICRPDNPGAFSAAASRIFDERQVPAVRFSFHCPRNCPPCPQVTDQPERRRKPFLTSSELATSHGYSLEIALPSYHCFHNFGFKWPRSLCHQHPARLSQKQTSDQIAANEGNEPKVPLGFSRFSRWQHEFSQIFEFACAQCQRHVGRTFLAPQGCR